MDEESFQMSLKYCSKGETIVTIPPDEMSRGRGDVRKTREQWKHNSTGNL